MSLETRSLHVLDSTGASRTEMFEGREHLVVPVVALMEGVVHAVNAKTPEFVSCDLLKRAAQSWNGRPIVFGHPAENGKQISANDARVLEAQAFGHVFKSRVEGKKLLCEAWVDVAKANKIGAQDLLEKLRANQVTEVSVGAFVVTDSAPGHYNGKQYQASWKNAMGDHLAFLGSTRGACSVEMGCGTGRFAQLHVLEDGGIKSLTEDEIKRVLGGAGSGNFGHAGRPGMQGGSSSDGGSGSSKGNAVDKLLATSDTDTPKGAASTFKSGREARVYYKQAKKNLESKGFEPEEENDDTDDFGVATFDVDYSHTDGRTANLQVSGKEVVLNIWPKGKHRSLGGPGSGNFGHSGRPGERGGSGEGGGNARGRGGSSLAAKHSRASDANFSVAKFARNMVESGATHDQLEEEYHELVGASRAALKLTLQSGAKGAYVEAASAGYAASRKADFVLAAKMHEQAARSHKAASTYLSGSKGPSKEGMRNFPGTLGTHFAGKRLRKLEESTMAGTKRSLKERFTALLSALRTASPEELKTLAKEDYNGGDSVEDCIECEGTGMIGEKDCEYCEGTGLWDEETEAPPTKKMKTAVAQDLHDRALAAGAECKDHTKHENNGGDPAGRGTMTKDERASAIKTLVGCECSGFTAADEKELSAFSDERIKALVANSERVKTDRAALKTAQDAAAKPVKLTAEQFMEAAPPEIKTLIDGHKAQETARKTDLIDQLKTAQDVHSEEVLKTMSLSALEDVAKLLKIEKPDYSGRPIRTLRDAKDVYANPPDPYAAGRKKAS